MARDWYQREYEGKPDCDPEQYYLRQNLETGEVYVACRDPNQWYLPRIPVDILDELLFPAEWEEVPPT